MNNIDKNNPFYKRLKRYFSTTFKKVQWFTNTLINNSAFVLEQKEINLKKIVKNKDRLRVFIQRNSNRIDKYTIKQAYYEEIVENLEKYIISVKLATQPEQDSRNYDYKNATIFEENNDLIYPSEMYDFDSLRLNLFTNNEVDHIYNDKLELLQ